MKYYHLQQCGRDIKLSATSETGKVKNHLENIMLSAISQKKSRNIQFPHVWNIKLKASVQTGKQPLDSIPFKLQVLYTKLQNLDRGKTQNIGCALNYNFGREVAEFFLNCSINSP